MRARRPVNVDLETWQRHAWLNALHSGLLLTSMAVLFGLLGWMVLGGPGLLAAIGVGGVAVLASPSLAPALVMRLYRATPLDSRTAPDLVGTVAALADRAGLPATPRLYYVPTQVLNAFSVGTRSRSAIGVTDGLLRALAPRELVGVLAHEVAHIKNDDLWIMGVADLFARMTSVLSTCGVVLLLLSVPMILLGAEVNWLATLLLIFAPHLSALAQLALSRTREFDADLNAVWLTGDPAGLASALARIEGAQGPWWERILLPGRGDPQPSWLRTHPETRERIARLEALARAPRREPLHGTVARGLLDSAPRRRPRWHPGGLWY